jgi:hypothetical protein
LHLDLTSVEEQFGNGAERTDQKSPYRERSDVRFEFLGVSVAHSGRNCCLHALVICLDLPIKTVQIPRITSACLQINLAVGSILMLGRKTFIGKKTAIGALIFVIDCGAAGAQSGPPPAVSVSPA